ncbi:deoxynucleoside kinase [Candidatus Woesearchaeota archaeon]|nr:deoxynucleoside kinase [Candidatus Woesearchaeota archaeon]
MIRPKKRIGVAGNIGSGKTLVSGLISSFLDFNLQQEVVNKQILDLYYSDMKKYAFPTQMFFLSTRYQSLAQMESSLKSSVIDRLMHEDVWIFSYQLMRQGDMTEEQFNMIKSIREYMSASLTPLDLVIYLQADVEVLKDRIAKRIELNPERENERELTGSENPYLENLNVLYEEWFEKYSHKKILMNTNKLILADGSGEAPFYHGDIMPTLEKITHELYNNNENHSQ